MTASWDRIKEVFTQARELDNESRDSFLQSELGNDPEAISEVQSLLDSDREGHSLIDEPTFEKEIQSARNAAALNPPEPVPSTLGPYRIERLIGQGGMGRVFLATQLEPIRRKVALKLLNTSIAGRELERRFEAERQVLASLDHPGIARIYDGGVVGDQPYFSMEFVDGVPLREFCSRNDLDLKERILLVAKTCDAVQHAHRNGIIHRDLKPSNILVRDVDGEPVVKVIDFGVAKVVPTESTSSVDLSLHTEAGQLLGTPEYMSPEQVDPSGRTIDTRSDIYSLGVVLYELVTGQLPFARPTGDPVGFLELQRRILKDAPPQASEVGDTIQELDWILQRAMNKSPDDRYASADEFAGDLRRFLKNEPLVAGPETSRYRARKFIQRNRAAVAAAAAIVVLLVGGVAASSWFAFQANRERAAAQVRVQQMTAVYDFLLEDLITAPNPFVNAKDIRVLEVLESATAAIDDRDLAPETEAATRYALGSSLSNLSQNEAARVQLERALSLLGEHGDPDLRLDIRHKLGASYLNDDPEKGVEILDEVVTERRERNGPDAFDTLDADLERAQAMDQLDFDKGLAEMQRVVQDIRRAFGPEHEHTLAATVRLADTMGRHPSHFKEAENLLRETLGTYASRHPQDDYRLVSVKDKLAYNLLRQGQELDYAEQLFRESADSFRRILGPDHEVTLNASHNLAACLFALGRPADAEVIVRELWEQVRESANESLPLLSVLVNIHLGRDEFSVADSLLRTHVPDRDPDAGDLLTTYYARLRITHGVVLKELDRVDESIEALQEGIALLGSVHGRTDWHVQVSVRNLCRTYAGVGRHEEAFAELQKNIDYLLEDLGPSDTGTQPAILLMAELHRDLSDWERAESTLVRYEEMLLETEGFDEKILAVVRDHLETTREARRAASLP